MRFIQWRQILGLEQPPKTQTRRLVKKGELSWNHDVGVWAALDRNGHADTVYDTDCRIKWKVGRTYAVQRPDGKTMGRTPPIRAIRQERLGDISKEDCLAEGILRATSYGLAGFRCPLCPNVISVTAQDAYACLWEHVHGKGAWERDEEKSVWVLDWGKR